MIGENTRAAVIANGVDHYDKHSRETRVRKEKQALRSIGLKPEELDFKKYFNDPKGLDKKISLYGLLWIRGGNVFNLRRAMMHSEFDSVALDRINNDNIVYGGYSAALAVAGPDLFGSELVDEPDQIPEGYPVTEPPFTALNLLDYYMAPHYLTDMPWRQSVLDYVSLLKVSNREVMPLQDGDVHIVERTVGATALTAYDQ